MAASDGHADVLFLRKGEQLTDGRFTSNPRHTNLAVLDISPRGFEVVELQPGVSFDDLQAHTDAPVYRAA